MKKFLAGFFLPLSILLLNGYGQQYAYACQGYTQSVKTQKAQFATFSNSKNSHARIEKTAAFENESFKIDVADVEEVEHKEYGLLSLKKKNIENRSSLISTFHIPEIGYFLGHLSKSLPFCKHFSYITSYKWYLQFGVFRIWFLHLNRQSPDSTLLFDKNRVHSSAL